MMQDFERSKRAQRRTSDPPHAPQTRESADTVAAVVETFAGLHDRVIHNLHAGALTLTRILDEPSRLDDRAVEDLRATIEFLDRAIQDIRTTAFIARQARRPETETHARQTARRYLIRIEDEAVIAYITDGHDFRRVHDDTIWAHESNGVLLSARSGTMLGRRNGDVYYDVVTNLPLYYQTP